MTASTQMTGCGGARRAEAVKSLIAATSEVHAMLARMKKVAFPNDWQRNSKTYRSGIWEKEDHVQGMWLGRALVWKMQVKLHRDGLDGAKGVCACFNRGYYEPACEGGGLIVFPDLGLAFR